MNIKSERKNDILVITVEGRLDSFEAYNLGKELDSLPREDDIYVVLDMSNVQYLSSGGIRVLLASQKKLASK